MENFILFDQFAYDDLLPISYTRPISHIRVGIFTIKEKWEFHLKSKIELSTESYLRDKFTNYKNAGIGINSSVLPSISLVKKIKELNPDEVLLKDDKIIALGNIENITTISSLTKINYDHDIEFIKYPWDIFRYAGSEIRNDIQFIDKSKLSTLSTSNRVINSKNIYVEEGAKVEFAILNAAAGPIYIGKNAEIMEGSIIRGPFALCEESTVKMGAKIYGDTVIGPHSKVGGEISNSVIQGFSNKGHDGFLGNSVIGEWCNLGADTNNSNLKNNYGIVKAWNYKKSDYINTGLQFCGLIMGDHSKSGINTMFNTGTVVGVNANIFGGGFPKKFIPSFSWGGKDGIAIFDLEKSFEVSKRMCHRRNVEFNELDQNIMKFILQNEIHHHQK